MIDILITFLVVFIAIPLAIKLLEDISSSAGDLLLVSILPLGIYLYSQYRYLLP